MRINYKVNQPITADQFITLLHQSTLGKRRPVDDPVCIAGMIANADLMVSAWDGAMLVGIARSITDFHYACYLSDLAVHADYQRMGIGRRLQALTQEQLGPRCTIILLAAPAAQAYYGRIGYTRSERCWVMVAGHRIGI